MAFDIKTTLGQIGGWLSASGHVRHVELQEPKSPPEGDLSAAVFMNNVSINQFYLNGGTQETHVVQVRLYRNMLAVGAEEELAKAVSDISNSILTDFDLGATIRNVDAAGEHGQTMTATWGYIEVSGLMYRVVDMLIPLIVDDSATAAA